MFLRSVSGVEEASFVPFSAQLRAKSGLPISLSLAFVRLDSLDHLDLLEHLESLELLDVLDNLGCLARSTPYSLLSNS